MQELYKQAILDAKAVRASAMANAKASLQEAFAPQVEALVKKSLSEDYEELEESEDGLEEAATITTHIDDKRNPGGSDKDIMNDYGLQVKNRDRHGFDVVGTKADIEAFAADYSITLDEQMEPAGLEEVDETTLEEILAELDELDSDDLKEDDEDIDPLMEAEEDEAEEDETEEESEEEETEEEDETEEMPEEDDETGADDEEIVLTFGQLKAALAPFIGGEAGEEDADVDVDLDEILGEDDDSTMEMEEAHAAEMEEAKETIEELRSTLNEVNLLNAKLLYMNKVFKAKTLTESQKVKVVSAFDRANSVKEVKNVYTTLSESLATPKKVIKESYNAFASKPSGFNVKQNITEMDPFIKRMQTLAGIK